MTDPGKPLKGRDATLVLGAELLEAFRHWQLTQTEFNERLAGGIINHVLEVCSATFDASTYIRRDYHVAAGSVLVNNLSTHTVTVHTGGPSGATAPTGGTGIYWVGPNTARIVSLGAREFTLWGTAADLISFQVFTGAVVPAAL